ncbi:hypothetical protein J2S13_001291 [Oikeobacillus pervagus]|uniref:Uncharacterized protein n=1 Tax=Oikeobacillus pervagus TaxID=1325931 RepID=A0AAJ1WGC2_9BACI|nr:hypothetical protein [Oikeobacillus pervagus]
MVRANDYIFLIKSRGTNSRKSLQIVLNILIKKNLFSRQVVELFTKKKKKTTHVEIVSLT